MKIILGPLALSVGFAACATAPGQVAEERRVAGEIAAEQGDQVRQICFTRSIDGWRALGEDALVLRTGVTDWHQVNLSGTFEPEWAFTTIGVVTRSGGSCVTRGDRIETV